MTNCSLIVWGKEVLFGCVVPEFSRFAVCKTWREKVFVLVRKIIFFRTKTKKIRLTFSVFRNDNFIIFGS